MSDRLPRGFIVFLLAATLLPAQEPADSGRLPSPNPGVLSDSAAGQPADTTGVDLLVGRWSGRFASLRFDPAGHYLATDRDGAQELGVWTVTDGVLTRAIRCRRADAAQPWENALGTPQTTARILELQPDRLRLEGDRDASYAPGEPGEASEPSDPTERQSCEQAIVTSNAQAAAAAESVAVEAAGAQRYETFVVVMFFVAFAGFIPVIRAVVRHAQNHARANLGVGADAMVFPREKGKNLAIERLLFQVSTPIGCAATVAGALSQKSLGLLLMIPLMLLMVAWQLRRIEALAVGHLVDLEQRILRTNDGDRIDLDAITSLQGMSARTWAGVLVTTDAASYTLKVPDSAEKNRLTTLLAREANLA